MFTALLLSKDDDGEVSAQLTELDEAALPEGEVTVAVEYSTLNYKDALAVTNTSPIVRSWPMVPGIDLAGTVTASDDAEVAVGEAVVVNGWEIGEKHWGGYAQTARVRSGWITKLPDAFSTRQAMAIGTAGYTAMLCVLALQDHDVSPGKGPIVVTGASGGVGSVAVSVLSKLGYEVHAVTGRVDEQGTYLRDLGAQELVDRADLSGDAPPLAKPRWAGAVDAVGGSILANVLAATQPWGCVAACGLAQSMALPTTVAPFILRGVTLAGVNSVLEPPARRDQAWSGLATNLDPDALESMTRVIGLGDVPATANQLLANEVRGRIVVDVNA